MRTAIDLFAGAGGFTEALSRHKIETVKAVEFDKFACQTYRANFPEVELIEKDIRDVTAEELGHAHIVTAGFPCQPFSIAGKKLGLEDERGDLAFEAIRLVEGIQPELAIFENVKGLLSNADAFKAIMDEIKAIGYYPVYQVLNTKVHTFIPQNRERVYILAFKSLEASKAMEPLKPFNTTSDMSYFLEQKAEDRYWYSDRYNCYEDVVEGVDSSEHFFQLRRSKRERVRKSQKGICPTLTAHMGTGGHNVPLVLQYGKVRKLTPFECFKLQGWKSIELPVSDTQAYKQAGNGITVNIAYTLFYNAREAIRKAKEEGVNGRA